MKRVYAVKDNSGHWYVIPYELKDEFSVDDENGEDDEWDYFNRKYGEYMTGGDLNNVELYAEI